MRDVLPLVIHLFVTVVKLVRPGGVRAIVAESLLLKHQILIIKRSRQRAPNLTALDRFVPGLTTLLLNPRRIPKLSALIKPATRLKFHKALVDRNTRCSFPPRPISVNLVRKVLRWNSSQQSLSLNAAIPVSARGGADAGAVIRPLQNDPIRIHSAAEKGMG